MSVGQPIPRPDKYVPKRHHLHSHCTDKQRSTTAAYRKTRSKISPPPRPGGEYSSSLLMWGAPVYAWPHTPRPPRAPIARPHRRGAGSAAAPGCMAPQAANTLRNSSRSIFPNRQCPLTSSTLKAGSGQRSPRNNPCGTTASTNCCRSASSENRLIVHRIEATGCRLSTSAGPTIISEGHHQRVLRHRRLLWASLAQPQHDLKSLLLAETLLPADTDHRPRIGSIGTPAQRDLIDDRRAINQPADRSDIRPAQRRIIEDRALLRLLAAQCGYRLLARRAERLRRSIKAHAMPAFILYLGK